ncbi:MAG TPA: GNAT family N-acetyltransferase [Tepidisphaeraceae bacterium]|nr:GNAT family N-acetyltransferase [Tepidisphaeraceae bacterium]
MRNATEQSTPRRSPADGSVSLRPAREGDAEACGRIIFEAFRRLAERHHFPPDFPSAEAGVEMARGFIAHPSVFGVVAEHDGRVIGSNFLTEFDEIRAVGPITVDPASQARGVGRRLMQAVMERAAGAAGVRLVQDAFNTASISLYASLGFDAREPLALVRGVPTSRAAAAGVEVRPMCEEDLPGCAELCRKVHGVERTGELRLTIGRLGSTVLLRGGRVAAYVSAPRFWVLNHGVAETEEDMRALLLAAGAAGAEPLSFLLPIQQAGFFRWCLSEGFRVVKPMTLMTVGKYHEPRGHYFPSVLY